MTGVKSYMSIIYFHVLYLHSSLMWLWMSDCSFTQCTLNIYQNGYNAVWLLYGWCTSLQCHFIQSHICRMHVCLAVTCYLHLGQNDLDLLHATVVTHGWNGYWNKSAQKVYPWEEKFPSTPARTQTWDFLIMSLLLYHWAIPTPEYLWMHQGRQVFRELSSH